MTVYERIQKVIDTIESNLKDEISLKALASVACYSEFHFHRLFQMLNGEPVMEYIRKRRLTCAAEELVQSKRKIIEIAFDYQFNTHESFTRAFKRYYGVNPGEYRLSGKCTRQPYHKIDVLERMNNFNEWRVPMEPVILQMESFSVLGFQLVTTIDANRNFKEIPLFWKKFYSERLFEKIPYKKNGNITLGLCGNFDSVTKRFTYTIGYEIENVGNFSDDLIKITLPATLYARFTTPKVKHDEFVDCIQEATRYIYGKWMPQSDYEYNSDSYDIEWYDERSNYTNELFEMDIYLPVKKK
jgi:AraC family transcriptional regulator